MFWQISKQLEAFYRMDITLYVVHTIILIAIWNKNLFTYLLDEVFHKW